MRIKFDGQTHSSILGRTKGSTPVRGNMAGIIRKEAASVLASRRCGNTGRQNHSASETEHKAILNF